MKPLQHSLVFLFVTFSGCGGCGPALYVEGQHEEPKVINPEEYGYMLCFVPGMDTRSAQSQWSADAHRFMTQTVSNYFRDRSEPSDRVLLARLDEEDPLLWQGTPKDLTREFKDPESLRVFLKSKESSSDHCFASLAGTLDYLDGIRAIHEGRTKALVVVMSGFLDKSPTKEEDMSKFSESLKRFCKGRNEIGFWWTDWKATKDIQKSFRDAGLPVPEWIIEPPKPLRFNQ